MIGRERVYSSRFLAGQVKRYHTWPTITTQTVGAHSWRVACIFVELFGHGQSHLVSYCLLHDLGELWAGDLPFGTKSKTLGLPEAHGNAEFNGLRLLGITPPKLTELEKAQCKICDLLEMWEFGTFETHMGNEYAATVAADTLAQAQKIAGEFQLSEQVNNWLKGGME
jgi:5'-deoxynucleotidase YfbR-like HD superfamily hydrolase